MNSSLINIAYFFSPTYALQTGVMLQSLLEHCSLHVRVFLVIADNIPDEDLIRFRSFESHFDCEIKIVHFDIRNYLSEEEYCQTEADCSSWAINTLTRMFLPEILFDVDKLLALDGDMIVMDDITKLYFIPLGDKAIGAVADNNTTYSINSYISGKPVKFCFNAGMILMDLKRLRELKFTQKAWKYYISVKSKFAEQDTFNSILDGEVLQLPMKWNLIVSWTNRFTHLHKIIPKENIPEIQALLSSHDWGIFHYCGSRTKPWANKEMSLTPLAGMWWHYFDRSPWRNDENILLERKKHFTIVNLIRWFLIAHPAIAKLCRRCSWYNCELPLRFFFPLMRT